MRIRDWVRYFARKWFGDSPSLFWLWLAWAVVIWWAFFAMLVMVFLAYLVIQGLVQA